MDLDLLHQLWAVITGASVGTYLVFLSMALLGAAAGVIGSYAMLRRRALVGDALAHATLPGVCLAFLFVGKPWFLMLIVGAIMAGAAGMVILQVLRRYTRIKDDAALGIVLSVFFGLGIVLLRYIQNLPGGDRSGLKSFIYGRAAAINAQDALAIAVVSVVVLTTCVLLQKEFRLVSFDSAFARSIGRPVGWFDQLMLILLVLTTVIGLQAVGVVLIIALLVIPPAAARFWTERLGVMLAIAAGIGLFSGVMGGLLSSVQWPAVAGKPFDLPTGPAVVLVAALAFVLSLVVGRKRGLIVELVRRERARREFKARLAAELAGGRPA